MASHAALTRWRGSDISTRTSVSVQPSATVSMVSGQCVECVAEVARVGRDHEANATPAIRAWADQEAAAQRDEFDREYERESARLEALGYGSYSAGEIVAMREDMGLSMGQLARLLGADLKTVKRWEWGARGISDAYADRLEALYDQFEQHIAAALELAKTHPGTTFTMYRDEGKGGLQPDGPFPASWTRAVGREVWKRTDGAVSLVFIAGD